MQLILRDSGYDAFLSRPQNKTVIFDESLIKTKWFGDSHRLRRDEDHHKESHENENRHNHAKASDSSTFSSFSSLDAHTPQLEGTSAFLL